MLRWDFSTVGLSRYSHGGPLPRSPSGSDLLSLSLPPVGLLRCHDLKGPAGSGSGGGGDKKRRDGFQSELCVTHGRHALRPEAASTPAVARREIIERHRDGVAARPTLPRGGS